MAVNLSIKNAPDDVVALLRLRARKNHRSLQGELLAVIEDAVRSPGRLTVDGQRAPVEAAAMSREGRERNIERAVALMREGLPLGDRRFTRDEMHER